VPFGLFVRVPELKIDGLVHVSSLPRDYYHRDPTGTKLVGERTGRTYRLTDTLDVRLVGANVEDRKIDFVPLERADNASSPGDRTGAEPSRAGRDRDSSSPGGRAP